MSLPPIKDNRDCQQVQTTGKCSINQLARQCRGWSIVQAAKGGALRRRHAALSGDGNSDLPANFLDMCQYKKQKMVHCALLLPGKVRRAAALPSAQQREV